VSPKPKQDLSEFFKYSKPKKPPCKVGFAADQLGEDEKAQLEAALGQDKGLITNSAIEQWLGARNHQVTVSSIVSHRKGTCSCNDPE
jgi:hypothetical protein